MEALTINGLDNKLKELGYNANKWSYSEEVYSSYKLVTVSRLQPKVTFDKLGKMISIETHTFAVKL